MSTTCEIGLPYVNGASPKLMISTKFGLDSLSIKSLPTYTISPR